VLVQEAELPARGGGDAIITRGSQPSLTHSLTHSLTGISDAK
jgi:hypothetical protein